MNASLVICFVHNLVFVINTKLLVPKICMFLVPFKPPPKTTFLDNQLNAKCQEFCNKDIHDLIIN